MTHISCSVTALLLCTTGADMKPLKTDLVFQTADTLVAIEWRKVCELENLLAEKLLAVPGGPKVFTTSGDMVHAVVVGDVAWMLEDDGVNLILCSADHLGGEETHFGNPTSRFDMDLGWVDYEEDVLAQQQEMLLTALSESHQPVIVVAHRDAE